MGGNRSGKSTCGIAEDLWVATGTHPYIRPPVPNRGRIGVTDFKVLEQVIWPKIEEYLPRDAVAEYRKGAKGLVTGVLFKNKSFFDIMSYEQLPMKWESVDLDWVHFDEPPPLAIWRATRPRLIDRDGRVWFTLTPLEEPWLYDEIWEQCGVSPRFWGMMLDMRKNPYLSKTAVNAFVEEVSQDDYEARVEGKFRHLVGKVFKNFTDEFPYVVDDNYVTIARHWPKLMVVDPHEKTPWALQWYALDIENDTVFRFEDIRHNPADGIEAFGNTVRNIELSFSSPVSDHMRIIDSYAVKPTYNKGGNSLIDEITAITGMHFRVADKSDQGKRLWDLINRYRINPATNLPRIVTLAKCASARKELKSYVWDRHRTKSGQYAEEKQTPVKKNDHAISCDMYMSAEWPLTAVDTDPVHIFNREQAEPEPLMMDNVISMFGGRLARNRRLAESIGLGIGGADDSEV